jgi:hypothetical protein
MTNSQLINAEELRKTMWKAKCRPSMRALREWERKGMIPSVRIGRLVYFNPEEVRRAFVERRTQA